MEPRYEQENDFLHCLFHFIGHWLLCYNELVDPRFWEIEARTDRQGFTFLIYQPGRKTSDRKGCGREDLCSRLFFYYLQKFVPDNAYEYATGV